MSREFDFANYTTAPEIPGVKEAYLGYIPADAYLSIIRSDDGEIARGIFESNLRDFQNYNSVNKSIKATLESDYKSRFVLMNNGITIITRVLKRLKSNRFYIEDFQIVNGCQTSNVLFDKSGSLSGVSVRGLSR